MINLKTGDGDGPMIFADEYRPSQYPYGLCIQLDDDVCEKLGIVDAIKAGTEVTFIARAIVTRSTEEVERDMDDTGTDVSLSMQITDMEITTGSVVTNAAKELYGAPT
jgi:hypothetical protein